MLTHENTMKMFRDILRFAYHRNSFYRSLYDKNSIDIETCNLPDSLPFVTADDLIHNTLEMKSEMPLYRVCASSGTKRSPKLMFRSWDDFNFSVQNQIQLMQWCGIGRLDIIGIVQPSGLWGYSDLTQEATHRMGAMSVQLGNADNAVALELIDKLKITVLDIAPSRLEDILKMADKSKIQLESVRIAMCSGEMLTNYLRQYALERFNIVIYNQYGSEETDALGGETTPGEGMRLFTDSFLFEIIKPDGTSALENEIGNIVVTSLYHRGTPLIRYKLEDSIRIISEKDAIIEVLGRNEDYVVLYDSVKLQVSHIKVIIGQYVTQAERWQVRISQHDGIILISVHLSKHLLTTDEQKLLKELEQINIDITALYNNGIIRFKIDYSGYKKTGRGKQNNLVDERMKRRI